ncbi:MAG: hypothetical protein LBF21_00075 [Puniceicoccales bacterium]|jgi:hypothetical protein|nr:hypothetical protein [Puniceicoccales bacterium]
MQVKEFLIFIIRVLLSKRVFSLSFWGGGDVDRVLGHQEGQAVSTAAVGASGIYRGHAVTVHPDSPSPIAHAKNFTDFVAAQIRRPLHQQHFESTHKVKRKEKLLQEASQRLGGTQDIAKYKAFGSQLQRLQQQARDQGSFGEHFGRQSTFNGEALSTLILQRASKEFGEVTEQDNALQYALEAEKLEYESQGQEYQQLEKSLLKLDGRKDPSAAQRRGELSEHQKALKSSMLASSLFQKEIGTALDKLRRAHGQEIKDGYNLIPKAAELLRAQKGSDAEAVALATAYREKALKMKNPYDVLEHFFKEGEHKRKRFQDYIALMIELLGEDIQSANPSRSTEELLAVREGLFRMEITGQIHDDMGALEQLIRKSFRPEAKESFKLEEQLAATREFVKSTHSNSIPQAQMQHLSDLFAVDTAQVHQEIYFLHHTLDAIRKLPMKYFSDPQARIQLIDSVQAHLDAKILQEEEETEMIE